MTDLVQRSRTMLTAYDTDGTDGQALAGLFAFRSEIGQLARSAQDMEQTAQIRMTQAADVAAAASHRLDLIHARLCEARDRADAFVFTPSESSRRQLARKLHSSVSGRAEGDGQ